MLIQIQVKKLTTYEQLVQSIRQHYLQQQQQLSLYYGLKPPPIIVHILRLKIFPNYIPKYLSKCPTQASHYGISVNVNDLNNTNTNGLSENNNVNKNATMTSYLSDIYIILSCTIR